MAPGISSLMCLENSVLNYFNDLQEYFTVIPRITVLLGGRQKCTVNRGHGKSGEVDTCSVVKHDIGGTQRGTLYRDTINRGPVNRGITV